MWAILLVTALLGLACVATAAPASTVPAATRTGFGCHGHNPTTATPIGCDANWARAELSSAALSAHDSMAVAVATTDSHGNSEFMCFPGPSNTGALNEDCTGTFGGSGFVFTDMVDGTNLTTAEGVVFNSSGTEIDFLEVQQ